MPRRLTVILFVLLRKEVYSLDRFPVDKSTARHGPTMNKHGTAMPPLHGRAIH